MRGTPQPAQTGAQTGGRGAPGRVAEVHAQTRPGLLISVGFIVAAIVAGVVRVGDGWWVPLHLFVVGAMLGAISATTQMLAVTWSASPSPSAAVAGAQRWALAAGAVVLVTGREADQDWLFVTGGGIVIVSMLALAVILIQIRRTAVTDRYVPAIEAYVAAVVAGAVGMSVGVFLGLERFGDRTAELRGVHLTLNVLGLVGLVLAGTLPYFSATQVRSKMSPRATPTAMRLTLLGLVIGIVVAAWGHLIDQSGVVAAGLVIYAAGLVAIAVMLPVYVPGRLKWGGPRVLQLLTGLAWWAAMTLALAIAAVRGTDDRLILQALVIGGFAQIFVASLAYLGPVLRGGGHRMLTAGFATTRSWVSLVTGNVAAVAALVGIRPLLVLALMVWLIDISVRTVRLLTRTQGAADQSRNPETTRPETTRPEAAS